MQFPKANSFPKTLVQSKIMGPNPLKMCEEMLSIADECVGYRAIPEGSVVLDLGSGTGITTAMLAREYDYTAHAADLWGNPSDNLRFRAVGPYQSPGYSREGRCFGGHALCRRVLRCCGKH